MKRDKWIYFFYNVNTFLLSASLSFYFFNFKTDVQGSIITEQHPSFVKKYDISSIYDSFENLIIEENEDEENDDDIIYPVKGIITSVFNDTTDRKTAHKGIDIAVPKGTNVKAAHDGVVETARLSKSYGNFVVIKNEHIKTVYAHNDELCVKEGDNIKKGDIIAISGSTGDSTGPHVHFEVIIDGKHINPENVCVEYK